MARKSGLGKGFGINALIPEVIDDEPIQQPTDYLDIHQIEPNRNQPRKQFDPEKLQALSDSIKEHGIVQPIIVNKEEDYFRIVAGERRWRAAKMAGLKQVPVVIREYSSLEAEQIALVENLQREDLNPIEEAAGYRQLMDKHGLTQEQVSQKIGKSRPAIANSLRLLALPEKVQKMLQNNQISAGHAKVLAGLSSQDEICRLAEEIIQKEYSVRDVERLIQKKEKPASKKKRDKVDSEIANAIENFCNRLQQKYGTKIKVSYSEKFKGKIELAFSDLEQMNRLFEELGGVDNG